MKKPSVVYVALSKTGHPVGVTRLASEAREWERERKQMKLALLPGDENEFAVAAVEQYNLVVVEKPKKPKKRSGK